MQAHEDQKCEGDARKVEVLVQLSESEEQKGERRPERRVSFRDVAARSQDECRRNCPNSHHNGTNSAPLGIWLLAGTGLGAWGGSGTGDMELQRVLSISQIESERFCGRRVLSRWSWWCGAVGHGSAVRCGDDDASPKVWLKN